MNTLTRTRSRSNPVCCNNCQTSVIRQAFDDRRYRPDDPFISASAPDRLEDSASSKPPSYSEVMLGTPPFTEKQVYPLTNGQHSQNTHENHPQVHKNNSQIYEQHRITRENHPQIHEPHSQIHGQHPRIHENHSQIYGQHHLIHENHPKIHDQHSQIHENHSRIHENHSQIHEDHSRIHENHPQIHENDPQIYGQHWLSVSTATTTTTKDCSLWSRFKTTGCHLNGRVCSKSKVPHVSVDNLEVCRCVLCVQCFLDDFVAHLRETIATEVTRVMWSIFTRGCAKHTKSARVVFFAKSSGMIVCENKCRECALMFFRELRKFLLSRGLWKGLL